MKEVGKVKRVMRKVCNLGFVICVLILVATSPVLSKIQPAKEIVSLQNTLRDIAKTVNPAAVYIYTERKIEKGSEADIPGFKWFFKKDDNEGDEDYYKNMPKKKTFPKEKMGGVGSGMIVTSDGFILTNYHVIEEATVIKVVMSDSSKYDAEIKGFDKRHDLAIVKIKSDKKFPIVSFGNSDEVMTGDIVVAIGNPFGYANTVTMGIVSAKGRLFENFDMEGIPKRIPNIIQTDAPINPGNSGGPLVNIEGEVIGVNLAIAGNFSFGNVGSMGVGFAIPINEAKKILDNLIKGKKVSTETPWIGVKLQEMDKKLTKKFNVEKGMLISEVDEKGPGKEAGLKGGDVIIKFNGKEISAPSELVQMVAEKEVGDVIALLILRDGKEKEIKVELAPWGEKSDKSASNKEKGEEKKPSEIGLHVKNLSDRLMKEYGIKSKMGVIVVSVEKDSLSDKAEICEGDIIKEVDKKEIEDTDDFEKAIKNGDLKEGILLLIEREGNDIFVIISK
ncbi:MAG: Do family serine endopeptidase [Candidatus Firestonebacteria bacterium]